MDGVQLTKMNWNVKQRPHNKMNTSYLL